MVPSRRGGVVEGVSFWMSTLGGPRMHLRRLAAILILTLSSNALSAAPPPPASYSALQWRLVGPLRGGWATAASGVPGQPETFYIGAADGGGGEKQGAGGAGALP